MKISHKRFIILLIVIAMIATIFTAIPAHAVLTTSDIDIESESAIVIDYNTGAILYDKNSHKKIYPASTTKILTAILAIENSDMDDMITVSENALKGQLNNGTNVALQEGEQLSMKDAIYSMMLESANDSAIAIAEAIGGSEEGFAEMMNEKVKELGLEDTNFVTPNGLYDENHYTSAYDMAQILKYAYENEEFQELLSTTKYVMSTTNKRTEELDIYTTNRMVAGKSKAYEYYVGGKTGYIDESKCNLASVAEKDGMTLIAYVATNASPYNICDDTANLFNKCFDTYKNVTLNSSDLESPVKDILSTGNYQIRNSEADITNVMITLPKTADSDDLGYKLEQEDAPLPINKGSLTGYIQILHDEEVVGVIPVTAKANLTTLRFYISLGIKILIYAAIVFAIVILTLRIYFKTKKKKKRAKVRGYHPYEMEHPNRPRTHSSQISTKSRKKYHK